MTAKKYDILQWSFSMPSFIGIVPSLQSAILSQEMYFNEDLKNFDQNY